MESTRQITYRFISPFKRFGFAINEDDPDGIYVREKLGKRQIRFADNGTDKGVIETRDPRFAGYLRRAKAANADLAYTEDFKAMPLLCTVPGCPWTYPASTYEAEEARYQHLLNDHADIFLHAGLAHEPEVVEVEVEVQPAWAKEGALLSDMPDGLQEQLLSVLRQQQEDDALAQKIEDTAREQEAYDAKVAAEKAGQAAKAEPELVTKKR